MTLSPDIRATSAKCRGRDCNAALGCQQCPTRAAHSDARQEAAAQRAQASALETQALRLRAEASEETLAERHNRLMEIDTVRNSQLHVTLRMLLHDCDATNFKMSTLVAALDQLMC